MTKETINLTYHPSSYMPLRTTYIIETGSYSIAYTNEYDKNEKKEYL